MEVVRKGKTLLLIPLFFLLFLIIILGIIELTVLQAEEGASAGYAGSLLTSDMPEILTDEMVAGTMKSEDEYGIPASITESAKIDGANDFVIFFKLILPLSKPLVATLGLFAALAYWNDWYNCMLYVTNEDMFNLQYYLQRILGSAEALKIVAEKSGIALPSVPLESMKMAMTVIATGPIVLLYPFVQRYFVKGLTIGAVKG